MIERNDFATKFRELTEDIPDEVVARVLQISRPTVQRWRDGEAAPHSVAATAILRTCERKWSSL
jgi:DNA-binding transcriptional regulator YiaG